MDLINKPCKIGKLSKERINICKNIMHWTVHLEGGPKRVNHAAAAVGNLIYSFGGYCSANMSQFRTANEPIDVHVFNSISMTWKLLKAPELHSDQRRVCPFQRYGHAVISYNSNIFLWGGRNDTASCNQLYCFNTETHLWSCPITYGMIPPARDGHSACLIGSKMYIFGGFEDEFERYSQDVYCLDLNTMHWSYVVTQGECPIYRDFHSGTAIGNRMYIFGGRSDVYGAHSFEGEIYPETLMYLDTETMKWVKPKVFGSLPIGRRSHSAFVYCGKLYIFGGYNGLLNKHYNDLYEYCPVKSTWSEVGTVGDSPSPRRRQVAIVILSQLFLFGGTSPISDNNMRVQERNSADLSLKDHDDLYVLDLCPTLKTLSILAVRNYNISPRNIPLELQWEIEIASRKTSNDLKYQHHYEVFSVN